MFDSRETGQDPVYNVMLNSHGTESNTQKLSVKQSLTNKKKQRNVLDSNIKEQVEKIKQRSSLSIHKNYYMQPNRHKKDKMAVNKFNRLIDGLEQAGQRVTLGMRSPFDKFFNIV